MFRRGRCSHRPGKPCGAARLRGGRNRPPYMVAGSGQRYTTGSPHQAQRRADEMPAVPDPAARLPCIVGRAFTPAGKVCGGPEGYWQGQVRHPSVGFADSSPSRGAFQTAVSQKPPLQGEVDAPQGADGGVHCRFAAEVSCKTGQSLAPCFVRDDFRAKSRHFVLCAPKRRLRAAVLASSRKACGAASLKAAGEIARPTLRPGADGDTQASAPQPGQPAGR